MKLTTRGQYALKAVLDVMNYSLGKPVRLQEIADRQNISKAYLEQLFNQLRKSEIVKSIRGPGGGYMMMSDPSTTTVEQVLVSVEDNVSHSVKVENTKDTPEQESLKKYVSSVDGAIKECLNKSLKDINVGV